MCIYSRTHQAWHFTYKIIIYRANLLCRRIEGIFVCYHTSNRHIVFMISIWFLRFANSFHLRFANSFLRWTSGQRLQRLMQHVFIVCQCRDMCAHILQKSINASQQWKNYTTTAIVRFIVRLLLQIQQWFWAYIRRERLRSIIERWTSHCRFGRHESWRRRRSSRHWLMFVDTTIARQNTDAVIGAMQNVAAALRMEIDHCGGSLGAARPTRRIWLQKLFELLPVCEHCRNNSLHLIDLLFLPWNCLIAFVHCLLQYGQFCTEIFPFGCE